MEDFSKTRSTSGTRTNFNDIFNPFNPKGNQRVAPQDFQISEERSQQPSLFQQADYYGTLSTRANMLALQVERVKESNKRILQDSRLEQAGCENVRKYEQISKYNAEMEKQMKLKINQQAARLDREILELYKNRLTYSKQSDKQIKQQIQDLQQLQERCFSQVSKQMKNRFQEMKLQVNQLKKQTIIYKKQNTLFRQQILGKLNSVRSKLNADIIQEEQKRKSYDEIVQNLLQKSCTKAQQSLRRKLY